MMNSYPVVLVLAVRGGFSDLCQVWSVRGIDLFSNFVLVLPDRGLDLFFMITWSTFLSYKAEVDSLRFFVNDYLN